MADPPWDIHMELPYAVLTDSEMKNLRFQDIHDNGIGGIFWFEFGFYMLKILSCETHAINLTNPMTSFTTQIRPEITCFKFLTSYLQNTKTGMIFLWVTGRAAELARDCMKTWGYRRVEEIVWVKTNQLQRIIRTGRTGHWLNHSKEHCIVGVKGNPRGMNRNIDCDVIVSEVRETSRKPDEIYNLIERMFPNSLKVEIFGRPHNLSRNWVTIGNQLRGVHLCTEEILERYNATLPPNATPILPFDPNKPEIDPNEIMNPEMVCDPVPEDEAVSAKAGGGMLALEGPGGDHAAAKPTDNAPIAVGAPTPAGAVWQPPASTSSSAAVTMAAPLVMPAGILPPPGKQGSPTLVAGNVTNPAAGGLKSVDHSKSTGKSPSAKRRKVQSPSKLNPTSEHHTERTSKSRASSKSEDSDGGVGFKMPSASALLGDTNKDSSTTNAAGSIAAANAAWGAVAGASTTTSTTKSAWGALPAGSASGAAATTTTAASSGWGGTGTVVSSGWGGTGTSSVSSGWNTVSTTPTIPGAAAVQAASAAAAGGQASTANSSGMPPPTAPTTQHTITHKGQQLPIGHRMPGVPGATPTNAKGTAGKLPVSWGAVIPGGTPTNADGVATGTADQQRQTPTANTWAAFNKPGAAGAAVGTGPAPTPGTWGAVTAAANAAAAGGGGGSSTAAPQQWYCEFFDSFG